MRADAVLQTFDLRTTIRGDWHIEAAMLDLLGQHFSSQRRFAVRRRSACAEVEMLGYLFLSVIARSPPSGSQPDEQCDWYALRHEEAMTPETEKSGGSRRENTASTTSN